MRPDRASVTAFVIAFGVVLLGGDDYGRQRLPPGNIVTVQKDLLARVLAVRRPYVYPNPDTFAWFWWCWWLLLCNPYFAKLVRWYLQGSLWLLGGNRRGRRRIRVSETIGYRKTFMEDCVRQAIESGSKSGNGDCQPQVLVLAGGFDTLALRLSEHYPQVHFWEVDHPATSQLKQNALKHTKRTNFHLVPVDLAKTRLTSEILSEWHEFNIHAPTVIIVEGLLMYLTETQVVDLLQGLADLVGPQSTLAFDFVEADDNDDDGDTTHTPSKTMWGPFVTPVMFWVLQHVLHEPWLWGVPPKRFKNFVDEKLSKWKCCDHINGDHDMFVRAAGAVYVTMLEKR